MYEEEYDDIYVDEYQIVEPDPSTVTLDIMFADPRPNHYDPICEDPSVGAVCVTYDEDSIYSRPTTDQLIEE
jgi:hypothetical protein